MSCSFRSLSQVSGKLQFIGSVSYLLNYLEWAYPLWHQLQRSGSLQMDIPDQKGGRLVLPQSEPHVGPCQPELFVYAEQPPDIP